MEANCTDARDKGGLATPLLPHQTEAVEWMWLREHASHYGGGGGVLADDMGMGKTLDCIALAASTDTLSKQFEASNGDHRAGPREADPRRVVGKPDHHLSRCMPRTSATLIVAPLCLLDQWRLQIARHTGGRGDTLVYHGADRRAALVAFLEQRDVSRQAAQEADHQEGRASAHPLRGPRFVLTTYEIMQREHRHFRRGCVDAEKHAGQTFGKVPALIGANGERSNARGNHDSDNNNNSGNVGNKKHKGNHDSVAPSRGDHVWSVFGIVWFRVILDEAHRIRTLGSAIHEAAVALRAPRRWCVTGTPYNNSCRDLQALARFIGMPPYCNDTWWGTPAGGPDITTNGRIERWTGQFVLMRDKRLVLGDTLPTCTSSTVRVRMDSAERAFYDDLVRAALRAYEAFAAAPPKDRAKPRMFGAVLAWVGRLRQACNHPLLAMGRHWRDGASRTLRCACCARPADGDPAGGGPGGVASCGHRLCAPCLSASTRDAPRRTPTTCAACGAASRWTGTDDDPSRTRSSTKMRTLVAYCKDALAADPTARIVVFSQWTACLDLAEGFLRESKIASVRYDGDVSGIARRAAVLAAFSTSLAPLALPDTRGSDAVAKRRRQQPPQDIESDGKRGASMSAPYTRAHAQQRMMLRSGTAVGEPESARVLLASLHCAGVGLDLSAANHVVLVDAWYNPFIEKQACDRVYRIGQTREVKVLRLCVASSVEADVARIQARKLREAATLGLGTHTSSTEEESTGDGAGGQTGLSPESADGIDPVAALTDADIHEIFRRAMTRCRLCPVPSAPSLSRTDAGTTTTVTIGKRKRE